MRHGSSTTFGDLHFHTRYSDNRDRAPLSLMVSKGIEKGLGILRSADHHHNLDLDSWTELKREAETLDAGGGTVTPGCEITFKMGHMVVLGPALIHGTLDEGYRFLYSDPDDGHVKIIAHPFRPGEIWRRTRFPNVHAVEVVNGAVFRFFGGAVRLLMAFGILPSLGVYRRYLESGMAVAAVGSSDAHGSNDVGHGVTGFCFQDEGDSIERAIRERRCFAATDTGVSMEWELSGNRLRWSVFVDGRAVRKVRLYRGGRKAGSEAGESSIRLAEPGLYWLAFRQGRRTGVSSPVDFRPGGTLPEPYRAGEAEAVLDDLAYLTFRDSAAGDGVGEACASGGEVEIYGERPRFFCGSEGTALPSVSRLSGRRTIISACGPPSILGEYMLWLDRNEVHEYAFSSLTWRKRGGTLVVSGSVIPGLRTDPGSWSGRMREARTGLEAAASGIGRVRISIGLLPRWRLRVPAGSNEIEIRDGELVSDIRAVTAEVPAHFAPLLREAGKAGPRLIQVFR